MDAGEEATAVVLAANQRFYDAHEARDFAAMAGVWEQSDRATCVHPGWQILRGWPAVGESWQRIMAGPGRNQFILTNVAVAVAGDLAWVTLDENLVDGASTGTIAATNLFARHGDAWRLILHHGSPVMH
jgi:ketosteroid isomerase-like protein